VGVGVCGLAAGVGGVCAEEAGGERAEQEADAGGSGGQLGPGHSAHQHALPEGSPRAGVRQGLAGAHRLQAVPDLEAESVLVDAPEA